MRVNAPLLHADPRRVRVAGRPRGSCCRAWAVKAAEVAGGGGAHDGPRTPPWPSPSGTLELIVLLESARGVWDIRSIIRASPRITQVGLDESDLACDLGVTPLPEYDPHVYARGRRRRSEAAAAKVHLPVGIALLSPGKRNPVLLAAAESTPWRMAREIWA